MKNKAITVFQAHFYDDKKIGLTTSHLAIKNNQQAARILGGWVWGSLKQV